MAKTDAPDQTNRRNRVSEWAKASIGFIGRIGHSLARFNIKIYKLREEEAFGKLFDGLKSLGEKKEALKPRFTFVVREYIDKSYNLVRILPLVFIFLVVLLAVFQSAISFLPSSGSSNTQTSFISIQNIMTLFLLLVYFFLGYFGTRILRISFGRPLKNTWEFWGA